MKAPHKTDLPVICCIYRGVAKKKWSLSKICLWFHLHNLLFPKISGISILPNWFHNTIPSIVLQVKRSGIFEKNWKAKKDFTGKACEKMQWNNYFPVLNCKAALFCWHKNKIGKIEETVLFFGDAREVCQWHVPRYSIYIPQKNQFLNNPRIPIKCQVAYRLPESINKIWNSQPHFTPTNTQKLSTWHKLKYVNWKTYISDRSKSAATKKKDKT